MKSKKLKNATEAFRLSLNKMSDALSLIKENKSNKSLQDALHDTAIKRFEISFEYCWKLMKAALEFQGLEAPGPRTAIQESIKFGYIENPDFWVNALDARNGSVHDYFGISVVEYLKLISLFIKEGEHFLERVEGEG